MPNIFYSDTPLENIIYDVYGNGRDAGHKVNRRPHPEGVTWHNCPHRNHGCQTCVYEMEADGTNQKLRESDGVWVPPSSNPYQNYMRGEENAKAEKVTRIFWNQVRNRSKRND